LEELAKTTVPDLVVRKFFNISWLVIEEFSLLPRDLFSFLEIRLQQIALKLRRKYINLICTGDIFQLSHPFSGPIFLVKEETVSSFENHATRLYEALSPTFILSDYHRFNGSGCGGEDVRHFVRLLHNLRRRTVQVNDLQLLSTRFAGNLSESEIDQFYNSAHGVFAYHKDCEEYNLK